MKEQAPLANTVMKTPTPGKVPARFTGTGGHQVVWSPKSWQGDLSVAVHRVSLCPQGPVGSPGRGSPRTLQPRSQTKDTEARGVSWFPNAPICTELHKTSGSTSRFVRGKSEQRIRGGAAGAPRLRGSRGRTSCLLTDAFTHVRRFPSNEPFSREGSPEAR